MRTTTRAGIEWRLGIGGWYARANDVTYCAERAERGFYRWRLIEQGGRLVARATTLRGLAETLLDARLRHIHGV